MYAVTINNVECIRYAVSALNNKQLRDAYAHTTGRQAPRVIRAELLRIAQSEGFKFAANPGTGIVLVK